MIKSSDIAKRPAISRSVSSDSWWRASTHGTTASATSAASAHNRDGIIGFAVWASAQGSGARRSGREPAVSFLLAEQTPGPEDEDRAHHGVHDDHRRLRQIEGAPRLRGADDQAAGHRAADATEAADHHDDERIDDHADTHAKVGGGHRRRRHHA